MEHRTTVVLNTPTKSNIVYTMLYSIIVYIFLLISLIYIGLCTKMHMINVEAIIN